MTSRARTVLVLRGGPDAEHAVSLESGAAVGAALAEGGRHRVVDVVIDRVSRISQISQISQIDARWLLARAAADDIDVIFPVLHGPWGEGGPLQIELAATGLPFVGSDARSSALCMDKPLTKELLAARGIATPPFAVVGADDPCPVEPPLVLKPVDDGSSVDMRICRCADEVAAARRVLHPRRGRLLAERYIDGREVTVGLIDGAPLPLIEIVPATAFYDYAAKYERDDTAYRLDPALPPGIAETCRRVAVEAFHLTGCRHLARVDFMVDDAGPWFLELNTMPGFTSHSLVPMAARHAGRSLADVCADLVGLAVSAPTTTTAPTAPTGGMAR